MSSTAIVPGQPPSLNGNSGLLPAGAATSSQPVTPTLTDSSDDGTQAPHSAHSASGSHVVLIGFVNFASGGRKGQLVISSMQEVLGRERVYDLAQKGGARPGLERWSLYCQQHPECELRVVAAGGDGTVNWVLSTLADLHLSETVPCGILPLGTGNDTSRALGWDIKYRGRRWCKQQLLRMQQPAVRISRLDRWNLHVERGRKGQQGDATAYTRQQMPLHTHGEVAVAGLPADGVSGHQVGRLAEGATAAADDGVRAIDHQTGGTWQNYFSLGETALSMYDFNSCRIERGWCLCCRPCNFAAICCLSTQVVVCCLAHPVEVNLEVKDDVDAEWQTVELPSTLKSLDLLNIQTYAAGKDVYKYHRRSGKNEFQPLQPPSLSDGKLEVVCTTSDFHLTMMVSGLQRARRLAQCSYCKISVQSPTYVQLDGEAFIEQERAVYTITPAPYQLMIDNR